MTITHTNIESNRCFEKLQRNNYLVQINNNYYFTIINSLTINVSCANESKKSIHLTQPTNILNVYNCLLELQSMNLTLTNNTEYTLFTLPANNNGKLTMAYLVLICLCFGITFWAIVIIYFLFFASIFIDGKEPINNKYEPSMVYTQRTDNKGRDKSIGNLI